MRTSTVPRPPQIFAVSPIPKSSDSPPRQPSALLEHAISLTGTRRAKVCFVTTALGDSQAAIDSISAALAGADHVEASHLQLFTQPNVADVRAFLPVKTEPAQVLEHGLDELRFAARAVEVFIAQDQRATGCLCALLCDPERASVTEVKIARG